MYNVIPEALIMKTRIIRIGNSRGIRIPKPLLQEIGLEGDVQIETQGDTLIVRPAQPRAGWATAFQEMARRGDDALLDEGSAIPTRWDEEEWEW
jgi:antitoxin MazE